MSQVAKDTAKDLSSVPATKNHKIRITLTSRNVKNLEKVCGDLVNRSKDKDLRVKGPVRLPTKRLHIVTRKTVRSPFVARSISLAQQRDLTQTHDMLAALR